jgi:hypothetical protein
MANKKYLWYRFSIFTAVGQPVVRFFIPQGLKTILEVSKAEAGFAKDYTG